MYICNDDVCDPCCDFCWYCIHGKNGEPIKCVEMKPDFEDGTGYCDDFKCRLHEPKPLDSKINTIERQIPIYRTVYIYSTLKGNMTARQIGI